MPTGTKHTDLREKLIIFWVVWDKLERLIKSKYKILKFQYESERGVQNEKYYSYLVFNMSISCYDDLLDLCSKSTDSVISSSLDFRFSVSNIYPLTTTKTTFFTLLLELILFPHPIACYHLRMSSSGFRNIFQGSHY